MWVDCPFKKHCCCLHIWSWACPIASWCYKGLSLFLRLWIWIGGLIVCRMCVSRCLQCVGVSLLPLAAVCMLSNIMLLFPDLKLHFLLEGHVTREATWATGLWGSGFLVLIGARAFLQGSKTRGCCAFRSQMLRVLLLSSVSLLAAASCCLVSATGLIQGPLCLFNSSTGLQWGVPLKPDPDRYPGYPGYLYNRTLWSGVCLDPGQVVQWNVVLFSLMGAASGLQGLICGANVLNALLGLVLGPGLGRSKVRPVSV